jgi:hypothetical protein
MYLYRKHNICGNYNVETGKFEHDVKVSGLQLLPDSEIEEIVEKIAYWRKANAIHDWFVRNVQGGVDECQPSAVSLDQLQELVGLCKKVLENRDEAHDLLPTASGFFFGGTDYDEWYFKKLEDTIAMLEPVIELDRKIKAEQKAMLNDKDSPNPTVFISYEYQSSW